MLIDADPQGDLTTCLGWDRQDELDKSLANVLEKVIKDIPLEENEAILQVFFVAIKNKNIPKELIKNVRFVVKKNTL